jgi:hypothetical protein
VTAAQVQLERTSSAGSNPFTTPVGQDQSIITPSANTGGTLSGDAPGLFADTGDKPSCDTQTLIANLNADTAKATAWATALGLKAEDIPTYVTSLTPVVLRSDTAVTSYGYADSRFLAYPAVLQAGTAVFINSYGEPKAKCFSGNPLAKPASNPQANYVGPAWGGFAPASIAAIQRAPTVINNYTFVDIKHGHTVRRHAPQPRYDDSKKHCSSGANSSQCTGGSSPSGGSSTCDIRVCNPGPRGGGPGVGGHSNNNDSDNNLQQQAPQPPQPPRREKQRQKKNDDQSNNEENRGGHNGGGGS